MRPLTFVALASAGLACATSKTAQPGSPPPASQASVEKGQLQNVIPFDVAACTAPSTPAESVPETVLGTLMAARPMLLECLVAPQNRLALPAELTVAMTVSTTGPTYELKGNLTPAGEKCIRSAIDKLAFKPAQVAFNVSMPLQLPVPFGVKLSVNEGSDVAAKVRLAMPTFCECFSSVGKAPVIEKASLKITDKTEVSFSASDAITQCLSPKLVALGLSSVKGLDVPYSVQLLNAAATELNTEAPAALQFLQLDATRSRRAAETALKIAARSRAVVSYDSLVAKYKAKPSSVAVKDLRDRCAALGRANTEWISSLKAQLEELNQTQALLTQQNAEEWKQAQTATTQLRAATEKEIAQAEQVKTQDQAVCPK